MKLYIFGTNRDEPPVYLKLRPKCGDADTIELVACDSQGIRLSQGTLLTISKNGVQLMDNVDNGLGFELDSKARLEII